MVAIAVSGGRNHKVAKSYFVVDAFIKGYSQRPPIHFVKISLTTVYLRRKISQCAGLTMQRLIAPEF